MRQNHGRPDRKITAGPWLSYHDITQEGPHFDRNFIVALLRISQFMKERTDTETSNIQNVNFPNIS